MSLKHRPGRVVVYCDLEFKNWHTFSDGTKIRRERQYNELNRRITEPVNAIVISADNIPVGAEILINHNSLHDTNKIFDYKPLSGAEAASDIKHFSVPEADCYLWREADSKKWNPCEGFATALRIFEPYKGLLQGIAPKQLTDFLYVTSGEYEGIVVRTLRACDYEVIFQNEHGREDRIIRFRPNGDEKMQREPEAILIDHIRTEQVRSGELLVGLTPTDCKQLNPTLCLTY